MDDCIFCKIVRGEVPAHKLYEDEQTLAFLSTGPNNPGHTLVIPKAHAENIYEIPEEALLPMMRTIQLMSRAVKSGMEAEGINITMNNGRPAGQAVFHAHIHVIPRYSDDGYKHWPEGKYAEGEAVASAEKIKSAL